MGGRMDRAGCGYARCMPAHDDFARPQDPDAVRDSLAVPERVLADVRLLESLDDSP